MTAFMSGTFGGGSSSSSALGAGAGTVSASSSDFIFDPSLSMSMSSSMSLPLPPWMLTQQQQQQHGHEHDLLERYHLVSTSSCNSTSNSQSLPQSIHQGSFSHPSSTSQSMGYVHNNAAHPSTMSHAFSQSHPFSQSHSHFQSQQPPYNQAARTTQHSPPQLHPQHQQQQQQQLQLQLQQQHSHSHSLHYPHHPQQSQSQAQSLHWPLSPSPLSSQLGSVGGSDHGSLVNAILSQIASVTQHQQSRPLSCTPSLPQQHHPHQSQSQSQLPFHSSWPSTLPLAMQQQSSSGSSLSASALSLASASTSSSPTTSPHPHPHAFLFSDFHSHSQPLSASSSSSSHVTLPHLPTMNHAQSASVKLEPVDLTSRDTSTSSASSTSAKRSRKRVKQESSPPGGGGATGAGTTTSTSTSTSSSTSISAFTPSLTRVKSPPLACLIPASEDLSVVQSALVAGKRTRRALAKLKPEERQHKKRTKHREADSDRRTKMTKLLDILDRMTGSAAAAAQARAQVQGSGGELIEVDGDSDDEQQQQQTTSKNTATEVQPPSRRTRNAILAASIQLLTKLARDVEELKTKESSGVEGPPSPSHASPLLFLSPSIMFAANLAMSIVDLDGRCLDVNSKYSSQFAWSRPSIVGAGICLSSDKIMRLVYGRDHGRVLRMGQEFRRQKAQQEQNTVHARQVAMGQRVQDQPTRFFTLQERPVEPPVEVREDEEIIHPSVRVYPQKLREPHIFPSTIAAIRDLLDGVTDSAMGRFRGCDGLGRTVEYEAHLWLTYQDSKPKYFICSFPQNLLAVMDQQP